MSRGLSWAAQNGLVTGVLGEIFKGIPITEETRVTNWAYWKKDIQILQDTLKTNYLQRGVRAVLFGVHEGPEMIKYAVFTQQEFLERE